MYPRICTAGLPAAGDALLHPLDAHVTLRIVNGAPSAVSMVLEAPVVSVSFSPLGLRAILRIVEQIDAWKRAHPAMESKAPVEMGGAKVGGEEESGIGEDMRCGLFERTQVAASRPGEWLSFPMPSARDHDKRVVWRGQEVCVWGGG